MQHGDAAVRRNGGVAGRVAERRRDLPASYNPAAMQRSDAAAGGARRRMGGGAAAQQSKQAMLQRRCAETQRERRLSGFGREMQRRGGAEALPSDSERQRGRQVGLGGV